MSSNEPRAIALLGIPCMRGLYKGFDLNGGHAVSNGSWHETALSKFWRSAQALDAAHEKGIMHQDLRPANISITPDGAVKELEVGLARLTEREVAPVPLTNGPAAMRPKYALLLFVLLCGQTEIVIAEPAGLPARGCRRRAPRWIPVDGDDRWQGLGLRVRS